jgi:cell wall-associated NlpC family hydrolase
LNINILIELMKIWGKRLDVADRASQIRALSLMLEGAPYVWGAENPGATDCSGTVCFPLWALGYDLRTTADTLFKAVYTLKPKDTLDLTRTMAVFYVTKKEKLHFNRMVPAGTATHVTPVVGHNVVLNAVERITLDTAREVREYFEARDSYAEWREIDWDAVDRLHKSGKYAWGFDPVLKLIRTTP